MESLPTDKLSSLLAATVEDCRATDKWMREKPGLRYWDMRAWIEGSTHNAYFDEGEWPKVRLDDRVVPRTEPVETCALCMAGAVMLQRQVPNGNWADAVDQMRSGGFCTAYKRLFGKEPTSAERTALVEVVDLFNDLDEETPRDVPSGYLTWEGYDQIVKALQDRGL